MKLAPQKNIGLFDRVLRLSIGLGLLIYSYFFASWVAFLFGIFSIYEGLNSWCVMYQLFGINTCPLHRKNK